MSTINITGTGGIIEGNLGTANVNVNLDASVRLSTGNTSGEGNYIGIPTNADIEALETGGTISAWCKFNSAGSAGNYPNVIGLGTGGASGLNVGIFRHSTNDSVFYNVKFADGTNSYLGSSAITHGTWNHFAISFDSGAYNSYFNGVLVNNNTTAQDLFTLGTQTRNGDSLCGAIGTNLNNVESNTNDMEVADARIYSSALSQADIQILASKIQSEPSLVSASSNLLLRYKLDGNDISSSTVDNAEGTSARDGIIKQGDGTASTHTLLTDAYSVDVYDNSTTTDGTFTVTQGKVEGLSLTSLDFDGSSDKITSTSFTLSHDNSTFAVWVKKSNATGNEDTIIGQASDANQHWLKIDTDGDIELRDYPNTLRCDTAITDTNWHHLAVTMNGDSNGAIYVDGVAQTLTSNAITADPSFDVHGIRGTIDEFHGKMRDSKVFDYALSAEQVASLYSGTYPQTPEHNWKMNDGGLHPTGEPYVEDFGTGTDSDGVRTGATWSNGTLDLDGNLTIAANGTLSAPRGNLDLASDLTISATTVADQWIHNSGKVRYVAGAGATWRPKNATFNNIDLATSSGHDLLLNQSITILGTLDLTGSTDYWIVNPVGASSDAGTPTDVTMTMGSTTASGTIESNNADRFRLNTHSAGKCIIQGASSLFPCNVTGNDWKWDYAAGAAGTELANMNFQVAVDTHTDGSNAAKITLTGDCEFDAVTVSSGDTLDLNGQRAVFSGQVDPVGTLNMTNSLVYMGNRFGGSGGGTVTESGSTVVFENSGSLTNLGDSNGVDFNNCFINNSSGTMDFINDWDCSGFLKIGAGTFKAEDSNEGSNNINAQDLTIATGGTLTMESTTATCSGDFTTSGGLLGASCLRFTSDKSGNSGQEDYAQVDDHADLDFASSRNALTLECWFKVDHNDTVDYLFDRRDGQDVFYLHVDPSNKLKGRIYTNGTTSELTSVTDVNDQKWHHCALVYDGDTGKHSLYVDGKLDVQETGSGGIYASASNIQFGARHAFNDAHFLDGEMDEIRMFAAAKTAAQIRADMFKAEGTALTHFNSLADASTDGLIGRWSCNEGTGSSLVSTGNTDVNATIKDYNGGSPQTLTGGAWAGGGTFTQGTSTLVFAKSGTQLCNFKASDNFNNITINAGSTVSLKGFGLGSGNPLDCFGNLVVTGTLTDSGNSSIMKLRTAGKTHDFSGTMTGLYMLNLDNSGSTNVPALNTPRLKLSSTATAVATGNHTITEELEVNSGTTFNANGNTIAAKEVDVNGSGTLDLRNSTLNFSVTSSGDSISMGNSATLLSGNTNINGNGSSTRTGCTFGADGGFEVVGDVKDLNMQSGTDLTVVGSVTNCTFSDSTANIRQWHHTLDTQQLLDADEAGDDDLRLTKPALDNALELMTK